MFYSGGMIKVWMMISILPCEVEGACPSSWEPRSPKPWESQRDSLSYRPTLRIDSSTTMYMYVAQQKAAPQSKSEYTQSTMKHLLLNKEHPVGSNLHVKRKPRARVTHRTQNKLREASTCTCMQSWHETPPTLPLPSPL